MRVIIHAGMHKTGTSAIQDSLHVAKKESFRYARWTSSNHCGLFALLFMSEQEARRYHGFRARGEEFLNSLPAQREQWLAHLENDLNEADDRPFIFSAEDISHPGFRNAVVSMRDFFARHASDVKVIAYARSPRSFAESAFQQMLKGGGLRRFDLPFLWPRYRLRFETLDDLFGHENVTLKVYERSLLKDGDIVSDFCDVAELNSVPSALIESNASLSAEATAILFVHRRLGPGFVSGYPLAQAHNHAFIEAIRSIGRSKYSFASEAWNEVLAANKEDLDWIEKRVGAPLSDTRTSSETIIQDENDFFDIALAHREELEELVRKAPASGRTVELEQTLTALEQI